MIDQIDDRCLSQKKAKAICQDFPVEWPQFDHKRPLLQRVIFAYMSSSQSVSPRAAVLPLPEMML